MDRARCTSVVIQNGINKTIVDFEYNSENDLVTITDNMSGIVLNEIAHPDTLTEIVKTWKNNGHYQGTTIAHFSGEGLLLKEEFGSPGYKLQYVYEYDNAKQLRAKIFQVKNLSSENPVFSPYDSTAYEWQSGNIVKAYFYRYRVLDYITEYEYADGSDGRQFYLGMPDRIMHKNVARRGMILTRNFCVKTKTYNAGNVYLGSVVIEPVFDRSGKLVKYTRYSYDNNDQEKARVYGELRYSCF